MNKKICSISKKIKIIVVGRLTLLPPMWLGHYGHLEVVCASTLIISGICKNVCTYQDIEP